MYSSNISLSARFHIPTRRAIAVVASAADTEKVMEMSGDATTTTPGVDQMNRK